VANRFKDVNVPKQLGNRGDSALEDALDSWALGCLNKCLRTAPGEQPSSVWERSYAAAERLKMAVREHDAAQAILEIGSNLMGCEEMAVLELHEPARLSIVASVGITAAHEQALTSDAGAIASAIESGQVTMVIADAPGTQMCSELGIIAFVPVWHDRRPRGAIVLYRLLPQRRGLDPADRELLKLFSVFAGPMLFNA
jgi:hypothetical protein